MKTSLTLWAAALAVVTTGCVNCGNLRSWQGGERESPENTVQSLRLHLCEEDWTAAAEAVAAGSEYARARGGDPTKEPFWRVASASSDELLFPLGPEDAVGDAKPHAGGQVQVEIRHAKRFEKDPRPRALLLENRNGQWLIVSFRNW